jgi:hypothetical protein
MRALGFGMFLFALGMLASRGAHAVQFGLSLTGYCQAAWGDPSAYAVFEAPWYWNAPLFRAWRCRVGGSQKSLVPLEACRWTYGRHVQLVNQGNGIYACALPDAPTLGDERADDERIQAYLRDCAHRTRGRQDWLWRDEKPLEQCDEIAYSHHVRYWTYNDRGVLVLRLPLYLIYSGTDLRYAGVQWRRDLACVQEFWLRKYGVRLEVVDSRENADLLTYSTLSRNRSDAEVVYAGDRRLLRWAEGENLGCRILLHELGHRLGMSDRYADRKCSRRPLGRPSNMMYSAPPDPMSPLADREMGLAEAEATFGPFCGAI